MSKFNRSQRSLLSVHMLKMVMDLFISTFLTSYILSQTPENILTKGLFNIGLFYVSWYFIYGVFEYICSIFVDRGNRVLFLRIGIVINTILIVALVFWGKEISNWIVLAGAICGLIEAFYYSSYLIMRAELSGGTSVKQYNMLATVFTNVIKVVVPIIMGYLIEASTLSSIAIYIVVISIIQFIISLFIKEESNVSSKFEFKKYINYLKTNKDVSNKLKWTYFSSIPSGFKQTYYVLVVVFTVYIFKKDSLLGIYTSIFSLVTMLCLVIYKLVDNNKKINKFIIYLFLGFMPVISTIVVTIKTNEVTLVILNFLLTLSSYFSDYLGNLERDGVIKSIHKNEYISEHQVLSELIQVVGRLIAFSTFMLVGLSANFTLFLIMLIVFILCNPIKFLILYKQRTIRKQYELNENAVNTVDDKVKIVIETQNSIKN